jgi:hypothetical protein
MVRVLSSGPYSVYVYAEGRQPHHRPHCHVRWAGGGASVALPDLTVLAGSGLPRTVGRLLEEHVDAIMAVWNALNPERTI